MNGSLYTHSEEHVINFSFQSTQFMLLSNVINKLNWSDQGANTFRSVFSSPTLNETSHSSPEDKDIYEEPLEVEEPTKCSLVQEYGQDANKVKASKCSKMNRA